MLYFSTHGEMSLGRISSRALAAAVRTPAGPSNRRVLVVGDLEAKARIVALTTATGDTPTRRWIVGLRSLDSGYRKLSSRSNLGGHDMVAVENHNSWSAATTRVVAAVSARTTNLGNRVAERSMADVLRSGSLLTALASVVCGVVLVTTSTGVPAVLGAIILVGGPLALMVVLTVTADMIADDIARAERAQLPEKPRPATSQIGQSGVRAIVASQP